MIRTDAKTAALMESMPHTPTISVYRRPLPSTNLRFVTNATGNIMWDGREASLESQASDATQVHGQAPNPPTTAEIDQMVEFEGGDATLPGGGVFTAQTDYIPVGDLTSNGLTGGPVPLVTDPTGVKGNTGTPPNTVFTMYDPWSLLTATDFVDLQRESVARGQDIFNNFQFVIDGVAGLNDVSRRAGPNGWTADRRLLHRLPQPELQRQRHGRGGRA